MPGRICTVAPGELAVDIAAPSLSRIYRAPKWMGDRMKHVIEPRLRYRYTAGIDDFERVIRFDSRDLIHNTNEAEVSITNRLYVKDDASGQVREAAVLEVWQRRYFDADFGGALVPGRRNVLRSSLDFFAVFVPGRAAPLFAGCGFVQGEPPLAVRLELAERLRPAARQDRQHDHRRLGPDQSEDRRDGGAPRGAGADGALAGEQPSCWRRFVTETSTAAAGTSP